MLGLVQVRKVESREIKFLSWKAGQEPNTQTLNPDVIPFITHREGS